MTRAGIVALALIGHVACSNAGVDMAVGTTTGTSTMVVTRTERGVNVENRVGRPLLDIRVEVVSGDSGTTFIYSLPTLDTGTAREIPFAEFRTADGTLFDAGSAAAKEIKSSARDMIGNRYSVTTPVR